MECRFIQIEIYIEIAIGINGCAYMLDSDFDSDFEQDISGTTRALINGIGEATKTFHIYRLGLYNYSDLVWYV